MQNGSLRARTAERIAQAPSAIGIASATVITLNPSCRKITSSRGQKKQEIASATKQAKAELSAHAAALALDLAAGRIRSSLSDGQSRGLVSAFIQDLEKVKN